MGERADWQFLIGKDVLSQNCDSSILLPGKKQNLVEKQHVTSFISGRGRNTETAFGFACKRVSSSVSSLSDEPAYSSKRLYEKNDLIQSNVDWHGRYRSSFSDTGHPSRRTCFSATGHNMSDKEISDLEESVHRDTEITDEMC